MNWSELIEKVLIEENKRNHESCECIKCVPNTEIPHAVWVSEDEIKNIKNAGIPLYYDEKNVMLLPFAHCLIDGPTGTGKSEGIYKNLLKLFAKMPSELKPSFMVTDVKGELVHQFHNSLSKSGFDVYIVDLRTSCNTMRYNPLTQIYDDYVEAQKIDSDLRNEKIDRVFRGRKYKTVEEAKSVAREISDQLLSKCNANISYLTSTIIPRKATTADPIWDNGARGILEAILMTMLKRTADQEHPVTRENFNLANVCRIAFSTGDGCRQLIKWLEKAEDELCVRRALKSVLQISADKT